MSDEDLIVGVHAVLEALRAGRRPIERVHVAREGRSDKVHPILEIARERGIPVRRESRQSLDRLAGGRPHQGVLALGAAAQYVPLEELFTPTPPLVVVLDEVQDPQNLGAVMRTAEAAGATGILVAGRRAAPLTAAVARASAGAVEHLRVARVANLVSALKVMKQNGIWVIGLDPSASRPWADFDYTAPLGLVLGGEHRGLRRLVRETCDELVRLPMRGRIASLNVSAAAAAVLYEAVRQRTGRPG